MGQREVERDVDGLKFSDGGKAEKSYLYFSFGGE